MNEIAAPASWIEALDRCAAEVAAGLSLPLDPVLDQLQRSADRLEQEMRDGARTRETDKPV